MRVQSGRRPSGREAARIAARIAAAWLVLLLYGSGSIAADLGSFYQIGDPDTGRIMPVFPVEDRRMVEPIHDVITPHVPLAPCLPQGPVRVLAIANFEYGRWPLELKQRLDVDLTVVYTRSSTQFGFHSGSVGMRAEDVAGRLLQALNQKPQVIISETRFDVFPAEAQRRVQALMADGVGYIGYLEGIGLDGYERRGEAQRDLFESAVPFGILRQLRADFETPEAAAESTLALYENERGRRAAAVWGYPRDNAPPDPSWLVYDRLPRLEEEAFNSLLSRVVLWCSGRPAGGLVVRTPRSAVARVELPLTIAAEVETAVEDSRLEWVVYDRDGRERHRAQVDVVGAGAELDLPRLPGGDYCVLVRLCEGGAVRDWALQALRVSAEVEITGVELADRVVPHEAEARATIRLSGAPGPGLELWVEAVDNYGRIVSRQTVPAEETVQVGVPTAGSLHLYNYVNVTLRAGDGTVLHEARRSFIIRQPDPPADELVVKMWAAVTGGGQVTGRNWQRNWKHARDGVDINRGEPEADAIYNMRSEVQAANMRGIRMISPTATPEVNTGTVQAAARRLGAYPLYHYHLGDDFSYPEDWTAAAREYLAGWTQRRYGDIARLNEAWSTAYADFSQVEPIDQAEAAALANNAARPDYGGLCRWVDQQLAREDMLVEFVGALHDAIREVDPRNPLSIQNTITYPAPNTGFDYWKLAGVFGNVGAYGHPMTLDVYRSARRQGSRQSVYSGSYGVYSYEPYEAMEMYPWWSVLRQMNALNYWYGVPWNHFPGVLAPDLGPLHGYGKALEGVQELKSGIAKLLFNAERQNDRIAVLYSQGSLNATAFLGGTNEATGMPSLPKPEEWSGVEAWSGGDDHVYMNSWEGLTNLLRDVGFGYDVVSDDCLKEGVLKRDGIGMLVLPLGIRVDERTAEAIREFVREGGVVLADFAPGLFDGAMRPVAGGVLADVFGVQSPAGLPQVALEQVMLDGSAADRLGESVEGLSSLGTWLSATDLTPAGATALARNGRGTSVPMLHEYGQGKAILLNALARDYQVWRTLGTEMPFRQSVAGALRWAGFVPRVECGVHAGPHGRRPLQATERVRFVDGAAEYVGILRDFALRPDERILFSDMRAHPTTIDFGREAHVYDVRRGVYRGYRRQIEEMIHPARARLYALLPYEVRELEGEAEYLPEAGRLNVRAQLVTADGSLPDRHVVRMEVTDATGRVREEYAENCLVEQGELSRSVPLGYDPPPGVWRVDLRDVASGARARMRLTVGG